VPSDIKYPASSDFQRYITEFAFNPPADPFKVYSEDWVPVFNAQCVFMMDDRKFLDEVNQLQINLVIVQTMALSGCILILPEALHLPFVIMTNSLFPGPWYYCTSALPSFYGTVKQGRNGTLQAVDLTTWVDLLRKSELVFNDNDHHLGPAVPMMPNVVSILGVTARPARPLPHELERVFSESGVDGVILVTFGSSTHYMPAEITKKFLDAFSGLKQTVIAKFAVPDGLAVPSNVKVMSWLPQNDILGHNKTKLFITHCGNNGQYEALYHGVPMIGFPLFAEQYMNCERVR
jgi:UDP:flavonoid glycosyltransferase YjiC (YdhE family)